MCLVHKVEDDRGSELRPSNRVPMEGEEQDRITCDCLFYRKWILPCRHLWQAERLWGNVLREEKWATVGLLPLYFTY